MMKKIFLPIVCGLALLAAASCESNLDIEQKGVVSYSSYYASDEDAEDALTSMYANFLLNVCSVGGSDYIDIPNQVMLNYSADDILAGGVDKTDHDGFRVFCEFTFDDSNATLLSAYQRYYYPIYHANLVISNFTNENRNGDEPKFTSEYTQQCVAEARVMRAYLHMMAALSWYNPPIMDRLYDGDELPTNAESQSQILEWCISECEKAISSGYLPERNGTSDKDATVRMSVGFAQFVAGKSAMFNNDYATARKYLGDLIDSGDYALIDSDEYWTLFHVSGDGCCESIFEANFLEDPAFTDSDWSYGGILRGRWMVADVFCWRTDRLASSPEPHFGFEGWNGGAIQEDFAKKFLEHDGDSPRRLACFLTSDEWLYEMDWHDSEVNDGTLEEKKADPARGIENADGVFAHGPYFEWKHMLFINPPSILTKGKEYPADNVSGKTTTNQTNYSIARYAEALLLYAEACIGTSDADKGLAALNAVQERSGSGKISSTLNFQDVMDEKQYELWFEDCRFHDIVRWSKQRPEYVDLDEIFNPSDQTKNIHAHVPTIHDEYFISGRTNYQKEHSLYVTYSSVDYNDFEVGKNEYFPFPLDVKTANPNIYDSFGWASSSE